MITFPFAKINLGLNIVSRRPDGYHDIDTVFYPIALTDVLEIVPRTTGDTTLSCLGNAVDCPVERNLVMRAYRLMQHHHDISAVDIVLYKHIPDGAGLGGGSSDAAHTLIMLNDLFDLKLDAATLASYAATLGADCPFFIYGKPLRATGIGDVFSSVSVSLASRSLLLVKPPVSVSTAEAYSRVTPQVPEQTPDQILLSPIDKWQGSLVNDFEESVFAIHPLLADIKQRLIDAGALYAAMSGSGSSLFGIFDTATLSESACDAVAEFEHFVINL